ncbi:unnamed protein product [Mytilus edulis]|uniref:Uncharacterized protein n=1 Tax=Mytilus edulis TaxID=6550 RepID=A0A8S3U8Z3_MYTED|nr:unnamed protein product [Mytilus edulis]
MCLPPVFEELDEMKPVNSNYRMRIHNMLLEVLRSHAEKHSKESYLEKFYDCQQHSHAFSTTIQKSVKEMLEYEHEQEVNLKEELDSISMPEMSQTDSQEEEFNNTDTEKIISCMAMDLAINVVETSYYQTMDLLGGEPNISKIEKSSTGKLLVFGGKIIHVTVVNDTHYLGRGPITFEIHKDILQKLEDDSNLRKTLYDHGVSYSELESALEKPNRVPRKRHLIEVTNTPDENENKD